MTQPTARQILHAELMAGEDPAGDVYADSDVRINGLIDAFRDEVITKFTQRDAREILARHRAHVLTEAADELERIADEVEAKVAEHYGPASGIGPGSADMVREAARTVRSLAARTAQEG